MDNSFGKAYRLLKTEEFSSVFALRKQRVSKHLQVFNAKNAVGHARLGLVVAKKNAKRANKRNYMKRVIRDWFRCHKHRLLPRDYVVRVRYAFDHHDAKLVLSELSELMLPK